MKQLNKGALIRSLILVFSFFFLLSSSNYAEDDTIENFSFTDIQGKVHQFSDYSGRWVIVNYWATYCGPCLEEVPDLVEFTKTNKHRATVLGFDAGGSEPEELEAFMQEHGVNYLVAAMQAETMSAFGRITAVPMSFIVSPEGELISRVIGVLDVHKIEQLMDAYENFKNNEEDVTS